MLVGLNFLQNWIGKMIELIGALILFFAVWLVGFVIASCFQAACGILLGGVVYGITAAIDQVYYLITGKHTDVLPSSGNKRKNR
jgi:hypothetical protein